MSLLIFLEIHAISLNLIIVLVIGSLETCIRHRQSLCFCHVRSGKMSLPPVGFFFFFLMFSSLMDLLVLKENPEMILLKWCFVASKQLFSNWVLMRQQIFWFTWFLYIISIVSLYWAYIFLAQLKHFIKVLQTIFMNSSLVYSKHSYSPCVPNEFLSSLWWPIHRGHPCKLLLSINNMAPLFV